MRTVDWVVPPSTIDPIDDRSAASGVTVAIPARYGSTRLPAKVLRPLLGRPMIEHVYRRAAAAEGIDRVIVLTDDERVAAAVEAFGGDCRMTPAECASGTDRIAWAARDWRGVEAIVNVQGDEPLIEPAVISRLASHLRRHPEDPIVTLAARDVAEILDDPDVVKVVTDRTGVALLFSRAAIPYPRNPAGERPLRHLGIYGYRAEALQRLAALEPSPLETTESLEQLRALENGIPIRVLEVERASPGVDTEDDLKRVEEILRGRERG
jgi:3-deoxy-manno-octulosonate cytidylyltransferase (CMP-KDO synthetase)